MAAKDLYHNAVVGALKNDGWTITADPLVIGYFSRDVLIDIGAEQLTFSAEKNKEKIAVEVKTFGNPSPVTDLQKAMGQYDMYELVLAEFDPERTIYLAVSAKVYTEGIFSERLGKLVVEKRKMRLIIVDVEEAKIVQWIK